MTSNDLNKKLESLKTLSLNKNADAHLLKPVDVEKLLAP
jgi:hypothetical protein